MIIQMRSIKRYICVFFALVSLSACDSFDFRECKKNITNVDEAIKTTKEYALKDGYLMIEYSNNYNDLKDFIDKEKIESYKEDETYWVGYIYNIKGNGNIYWEVRFDSCGRLFEKPSIVDIEESKRLLNNK